MQFDWDVPYVPGTLTAVGYDAEGNEVLRDSYKTASAPAAITLENTTGEELPVDPAWVGQVTVTTVDKDGNATTLKTKGRHDPCVLPRAVPIVEAMAAMVILDAIMMDKTTS
jgi:chorismate synthase